MQEQDTVRIALLARDGAIRGYAFVDAADADWISQWTWRLHCSGYASRNQGMNGTSRCIMMHRVVLGLPIISDGRQGDHIDHDRLNNRRSNLRIVSAAENRQNLLSSRGSTSAYRGVHWSKKHRKWRVTISIAGETIRLGLFASEQEAAAVAHAARLRLMPFCTG